MKKRKIDYQDERLSDHLGFLIEMICANLNLQVIQMLLTKFQVNCPFGVGEDAKIDFQDGRNGAPIWISDRNVLAIFDLQGVGS